MSQPQTEKRQPELKRGALISATHINLQGNMAINTHWLI